ncbi:hypothetical protein HBB16_13220 [Pseudonocardia sp. MCCB 268]|nr:hypothetical protein [Pseudonocardia cytotoxica]
MIVSPQRVAGRTRAAIPKKNSTAEITEDDIPIKKRLLNDARSTMKFDRRRADGHEVARTSGRWPTPAAPQVRRGRRQIPDTDRTADHLDRRPGTGIRYRESRPRKLDARNGP